MDTSLSRRNFFRWASAALAGATWFDAGQLLAAQDDSYDGWPIGVQSYSLRNFNTLEAVRHIQGLGLRYAEFYSKHLSLMHSTKTIEETKNLCATAGITINAHGVNGFTKDHQANRKTFAFARQVGIKNLTADPDPESFDSLDRLVDEFKIRICIHNHGPNHRYNTISDVNDAVKDHHELIGACVDTGHFIRSDIDPVEAVDQLGKRVFALHLKDDKFKGDARSHNVVIGKANLDVVGIFKTLRKIQFPADGSISLEYEANPDNPIDDLQQCLVVAREAIAKAAAS